MKVRKKPVVVDAFQWLGTNVEQLWEWLREFDLHVTPPVPGRYAVDGEPEPECARCVRFDYTTQRPLLRIPTKEGVMEAAVGDYIIRGIAGEFYPCKPEIFDQTYELL